MRPFVEVSQRRDRAQEPVAAGQHFFDGLLPSGRDVVVKLSIPAALSPTEANLEIERAIPGQEGSAAPAN